MIDGAVADMLALCLTYELEAAFVRHKGDGEMAGLFEQAFNAYQVAMLAATENL